MEAQGDKNLTDWVKNNKDELEFVAQHGTTKTIRAQAEALLKVSGGNNGKQEA